MKREKTTSVRPVAVGQDVPLRPEDLGWLSARVAEKKPKHSRPDFDSAPTFPITWTKDAFEPLTDKELKEWGL